MHNGEEIEELRQIIKDWESKVNEDRKFLTEAGVMVKPVYTPIDLEERGFNYLHNLGLPGEFPFTRGIYRTMYRGRIWTMRQYAGFGTPEVTNQIFKKLLKMGSTGLSLAFDLPSQLGLDSDNPIAISEVGAVGAAVNSVEDMKVIFDGIDLGKITVSMTVNANTAAALSMFIVAAEEMGYPKKDLGGTVQNDILKEYIARGAYIFPPEPSLRLVSDVIIYCTENLPKWNHISICGYHIRESGADPVLEMAIMLANGVEYVRHTVERGINVDDFAPRISWLPSINHVDFFEEIAKIRAARRLWARIMREEFNAKNPKSWMFRFYTRSGGLYQTNRLLEVNVIKNTLAALAAVLAGAQAIDVCTMDEALGIPSDHGQKVALRTLQVIGYETGITNVVDPLGGSYYLEWLTDELEERILREMEKIDERGGIVKAIKSGHLQEKISQNAHEFMKKLESKEKIVVGLNEFVDEEEPPKRETYRPSAEIREEAIRRLNELRKRRDPKKVEEALNRIRRVAEKEESNENNLMYPIIEAVKARCTNGEIHGVLREVFGEYTAPSIY